MHLLFGLSKATRLIEASLAVLGRGFQLREQPFQVQRTGEHNDALVVLWARPLLARAIPVEFHAVVIGVTQVESLGDAVIRGPVQRVARVQEPFEHAGELLALGVEDGEMEEARRIARGRRDVAPSPGVEADVVMVAARGEEHGVLAVPLGNLKT
jgi:hypothetical protein